LTSRGEHVQIGTITEPACPAASGRGVWNKLEAVPVTCLDSDTTWPFQSLEAQQSILGDMLKGPPAPRFGIGEWYGRLFDRLSPDERVDFAMRALGGKELRPNCPFRRPVDGRPQLCTKKGGVCSLQLYETDDGSLGKLPDDHRSHLRTLCPYRFEEAGTVLEWVAEDLLETRVPLEIPEVGFLKAELSEEVEGIPEDVGRIDLVLVHPDLDRLNWCAVEMQAVYFSGAEMAVEYHLARDFEGECVPFPAKNHRPDYRSSGPKRLMPQLQIKVPTLRRWGKKMAVVVDEPFFSSLGKMDDVKDPSNADIGWYVVRLERINGVARLEPAFKRLTTLERAVEGLTAGLPVTLKEFEVNIKNKLVKRGLVPRSGGGSGR